jgi:hypothetical protein
VNGLSPVEPPDTTLSPIKYIKLIGFTLLPVIAKKYFKDTINNFEFQESILKR